MSPKSVLAAAGSAALAAFVSVPAVAVVGGSEDGGSAGRSAIMVLNAHGGVCSGVVVAPDAVLTAAHCVAGPDAVRVHFKGSAGEPVLIEPIGRALHPGYAPRAVVERRRSIDLALLRTPAPLPARFAPASLVDGTVAKGEPVTVGGYGVAREGDARSTGTFRTADLRTVEPYGRSRILLWAAAPAGSEAGACEGDSGGPLFAGDNVVAVTSWAAGAGRRGCGSMTQGVLVGPQRAWIDRTLASWGREAAWR